MENIKKVNQEPNTNGLATTHKHNEIEKCECIKEAICANSFNGGFLKPIGLYKVMAGERIKRMNLTFNMKMLTPKTPTYQGTRLIIKTFFVPDSRVWEGSEEYYAHKKANCLSIIPNLRQAKKDEPEEECYDPGDDRIKVSDTEIFRDSLMSSYYPRSSVYRKENSRMIPEITALPFRGLRAIYNDFLRHKEFDEERQEFKGNVVTLSEVLDMFSPIWCIRGLANKSYYTDFTTKFSTSTSLMGEMQGKIRYEFEELEKRIAQERTNAENAQKNDWDIIAELKGTTPIKDGKTRLLSVKKVDIQQNAIIQQAYNNNTDIEEEFQVMGQEGAYSFTNASVDLTIYEEFQEAGYIHVIVQPTTDTIIENVWDRNLMNINYTDEYTPDLKELKLDTIYQAELDGHYIFDETPGNTPKTARGFKPKFSELFKGINCISGELTSKNYIMENEAGYYEEKNQRENKDTYQMFMTSIFSGVFNGTKTLLQRWKDYTDLLINKNQAIPQEIERRDGYGTKNDIGYRIKGHNQFLFMGILKADTILPVSEKIKRNYEEWGEL